MTTISKLSTTDLDAVDELMKRNSGTVGFLPLTALVDYLEKGWVLGAVSENGSLIAYLLYAANRDRFRITQLCVAEDFRGQGMARQLLNALKDSATTQKVIRLSCRNDFPAHSLWPKLGFVSVDEKPGRSKERYPLTLWRLAFATDNQMELFRANVSDSVLDVVIDAQIFFDFDEPERDANGPSKVLVSGLFDESVNIWYTDELLNEIQRNAHPNERAFARRRTGQFNEVRHDPLLTEIHEGILERVLPNNTDSQRSDIKHLAKTASSDITLFVTRDQGILKKAPEIAEMVNVQVLDPTSLILRLNELNEQQTYAPDRVSGIGVRWRRMSSEELSTFPFERFLEPKEKLSRLKERVNSYLINTHSHELEILWSGEEPIALRCLMSNPQGTLTITLGRVAISKDRTLFGPFLVSDAIYRAILRNIQIVDIEATALPANLMQGLSGMGFTKIGEYFLRFCFARYMDRDQVLATIEASRPDAVSDYRGMGELELELSCSPLISDPIQSCFLIPIRPGYALNLFDRQQSSHDLFGGEPKTLMRWSNVYYRRVSHQLTLTAPARILWYVSGSQKQIVGSSHLDEVVIDNPQELFRRFSRQGTLKWQDLHEMCDGEISRDLMALKFSHTFPLNRPVPLSDVRKVFKENGVGWSLQGPRKLTSNTYRKLFELGYPEQP